jgi:preprotein translocase subunit SecA
VESAVTNQTLVRLLGAVERRLEEPLGLNPTQLATDWDKLAEQVFAALEAVQSRRRERLLGSNGTSSEGAIARDLETSMNKIQGNLTSNQLIGLLMMLPQGTRAAFDKKTHRRVVQRTTRLTYTYLAAHLLEGRDSQEIADEVLEHLEAAQAMLRRTHGANEFARLSGYRLDELDQTSQTALCNVLGDEVCRQMQGQPLNALGRDETIKVMDELGRMALTSIYRRLLLIVITELWVDYLTQMEALRVSIGLEAYAQRDPLVQYKSKASELFQTLLGNMRLGVVSRMFTYRPANVSGVQAESRKLDPDNGSAELEAEAEAAESEEFEAQVEEDEGESEESAEASTLSRSQKRRRRRK